MNLQLENRHMTVTVIPGWSAYLTKGNNPPSFYRDPDSKRGRKLTLSIEVAYMHKDYFQEHEEIAEAWEKYDPRPIVITERIAYEDQRWRWPWFVLGAVLGLTVGMVI